MDIKELEKEELKEVSGGFGLGAHNSNTVNTAYQSNSIRFNSYGVETSNSKNTQAFNKISTAHGIASGLVRCTVCGNVFDASTAEYKQVPSTNSYQYKCNSATCNGAYVDVEEAWVK